MLENRLGNHWKFMEIHPLEVGRGVAKLTVKLKGTLLYMVS